MSGNDEGEAGLRLLEPPQNSGNILRNARNMQQGSQDQREERLMQDMGVTVSGGS